MRHDLIRTQQQRNAETADAGDGYADHRDNVMRLIMASAAELRPDAETPCDSIALLGIGNGLDVDLPQIATCFRNIHLVDVDDTAVLRLVTQNPEISGVIWPHAPIDIASPLLSLTSRDFRAVDENIEHCTEVLQQLSKETFQGDLEPGSCDVVASLCVLSQLVGSLAEIINSDHPAFINAVKAMRIGHLRRMLNLLKPGGIAVLVTDVVSSDTAPEILSTSAEELSDLLKQLVSDRNFFTGTNPAQLLSDLNVLERLPQGPETVQVFDPWIWNLGPRSYAVNAVRFQARRPADADSPAADSN